MSRFVACVPEESYMVHDPHKPLRADIRLLGELLGETLRHHAGQTTRASRRPTTRLVRGGV